jgi:8-oxo-dGTP pyrophosphatase MutT (NUDIX family)
MNNQLEITSNFEQFKIGFINRLINNYEDTIERQLAIDKTPDLIIEQAIRRNAFCKEILPILWDAVPSQNEKDYCYNSHTVYVRILDAGSRYNKELKVKCYFHGGIRGNPIKGHLFKSEMEKITTDSIIDVIKEAAIREVVEETNIKLEFIDHIVCSLNLYNNTIMGNYEIVIGDNKHTVTITLSSNNYALLKRSFQDNLEVHTAFMENTGEISGLIL